MTVNITNIQHFSVGDGDGIRTTVFFAGCNLRCPWCHNPETVYTRGRKISTQSVVDDVMEDADFYIESGGGVTLSGGECLLQADAALDITKKLKEKNVSVFIDTAGNVPFESIEKLMEYTDCWLFDIKTHSESKFSETCGGDLALVLSNLSRLHDSGSRVCVRIPLIPRFNVEDASKIKQILDGIGITEIEPLPFHRLGTAKYKELGLNYEYADTEPLSKERLNQIKTIFKETDI